MEYFNERPISTQQSGFVFVAQMRAHKPDPIGGVLWFGVDDANMAVFTPVYCCATKSVAVAVSASVTGFPKSFRIFPNC